ncbi:MAG: fumarate hydratase C-terminal domain-containing protein [Chloroflexi bacterium]|nr:fumarate hydratase C-terminal domain-containing protein [Chloroflexota bacterium]
MKTVHLQTPLTTEQVRSLQVGDTVFISGTIWTCRSRFHSYFIDEGHQPPLDTKEKNVLIHCGPIMEWTDTGWKNRAISITSSIRFEKWSPEVIRRLNIKAIIGKGTMGDASVEAMKEVGCVHLSRTGVFAGAFSSRVKEVSEVHWLHLGLPEALWVLEITDFGPLVVEIDVLGRRYHSQVAESVQKNLPLIYQRLGIADFHFAEK